MEYTIVAWLLAHWGAAGMALGLVVLLTIRFLPQYVSRLRERSLAEQQRRISDKAEISNREHDLFARIDRKDQVLEKLTGNHIQHLEAVMAKSDAFHVAAVEHLRAMTSDLRELRGEVSGIRAKVDDVQLTVREIRAAQ